ncbi:putative protein kinase TKL-Pl-5 family [Helianthus annuus]|uniref:Putative receptor-like tyrosine-protein kinase kin-15 n=1 Tax=Helianthus annuus TaxID=4232 RepID=A0A251T9R4_HELAN|nr:putative protein kinase TKL-Pl-5 family [Helianthus annuus]KAJ0508688.1 putative protein kinase TKL-Pl-5 family [Helianthus annuus]KAJ0516905.1 putative protein kinase TKL-Pl-5 family [Helianthus annuus]KAJ0734057.1 putative protein kinase TKL-Pl-5 family [Helianthus annuus]KAJ0874544.1 putative protein kinase TKL-Pl-5 family [Helianthus annuus]
MAKDGIELWPTLLDEVQARFDTDVGQGTFSMASWRGTQVAVKKLGDELFTDEDKVDELELLKKIRHPNVVQFLGAVTQSSPMMIVIEYFTKGGDLKAYLKRKGALKPLIALKFAMDIARNILLDDSGHLKVADFGVSELLKGTNAAKHKMLMNYQDTTSLTARRYVASEVFKNEDYDTKVDVFSFALILQEVDQDGIRKCMSVGT